ncbi:hypothetical protein GCM10010394_20940 [Streptomyces crystallinus]|uniref:Uncharacterized protein n=1 Tax=Streptomyces crystallinus TaxID=68191 RepID=A0ABP3QIM0_9ACTN
MDGTSISFWDVTRMGRAAWSGTPEPNRLRGIGQPTDRVVGRNGGQNVPEQNKAPPRVGRDFARGAAPGPVQLTAEWILGAGFWAPTPPLPESPPAGGRGLRPRARPSSAAEWVVARAVPRAP